MMDASLETIIDAIHEPPKAKLSGAAAAQAGRRPTLPLDVAAMLRSLELRDEEDALKKAHAW